MKKLNCWEFKGCGREPGGVNVSELGVCQAAIDQTFHKLHDGTNCGRACWVIAGTMAGGILKGCPSINVKDCTECPFFKHVQREEKDAFVTPSSLIKHLKALS